jgi:hypothetical protein
LNLSSEFLNYNQADEEKILAILTYTFTELTGAKYVQLYCFNQEINWTKYAKSIFSQDDFKLNAHFNSKDFNQINRYLIYYIVDVANANYLVPVNVYDVEQGALKDQLDRYLGDMIDLPVFSDVDQRELSELSGLAYYQAYLTYYHHQLTTKDETVDVKKINVYQIELK